MMLVLIVVFVTGSFSGCSSHVCMLNPVQRNPVDYTEPRASERCYEYYNPPCGRTRPGKKILMYAGQQLSVVMQKNLDHYQPGDPGEFSVSIGEEMQYTPLQTLGSVPDTQDPSLTIYTINVTLPQIQEERKELILQGKYSPRGRYPPFFSCADIVLLQPRPAIPVPTTHSDTNAKGDNHALSTTSRSASQEIRENVILNQPPTRTDSREGNQENLNLNQPPSQTDSREGNQDNLNLNQPPSQTDSREGNRDNLNLNQSPSQTDSREWNMDNLNLNQPPTHTDSREGNQENLNLNQPPSQTDSRELTRDSPAKDVYNQESSLTHNGLNPQREAAVRSESEAENLAVRQVKVDFMTTALLLAMLCPILFG